MDISGYPLTVERVGPELQVRILPGDRLYKEKHPKTGCRTYPLLIRTYIANGKRRGYEIAADQRRR
ncbi:MULTISPECIES: hypothetical protein [unclassified Mycobacterium]|uniref:hypothetical protein n=1 Tax=unclassified Mycobacterium TaxID=2642494 RepID=UPI0029C6DC8D|nr:MULTISPECIES: hypothetical protein [unclassified Mycobacterium]